MSKRMLLLSILVTIMLLTLSLATIVSSNKKTSTKNKISPLFKIRTNKAVSERFSNIKDFITNFLSSRRLVFFPLFLIDGKLSIRNILAGKFHSANSPLTTDSCNCFCVLGREDSEEGVTWWPTNIHCGCYK